MGRDEVQKLKKELAALSDPRAAEKSSSFFRSYPGGYGEGDRFLGIRVPDQRKAAKRYAHALSLGETVELLHSSYHEHRLTALLILVRKYERGDAEERERVVSRYLEHLSQVNNWDLVDSSANKILGPHLYERIMAGDTEASRVLFDLANSGELWRQRTAVIATQAFIRKGRYSETFKLAELLLQHPHDLIHKAVGWMLREVGKRDFTAEYEFLRHRYAAMPRTMLRYAVEKFDESVRQQFLTGRI
jgi:3-methyladenine DNA glycosylase AlkD